MPPQLIQPFGQFDLLLEPQWQFTLKDSQAIAVSLRCEKGALARVLETTFGWAKENLTVTPLQFLGLDEAALAVFTDFRSPSRGMNTGTYPYLEMDVFIPVLVQHKGSAVPVPALHMPYLYIDFVPALVTGRELYGLQKKPGLLPEGLDMLFDELTSGSAPLTVKVRAARNPGDEWTEHELLNVRVPGAQQESPISDETERTLLELLSLPLIQLKQFAAANARCLYRAVTRIQAPFTNVVIPAPRGENIVARNVSVTVAPLHTERLHEVVASGTYETLLVNFNSDFTLCPHQVLHEEYYPELPPAASGASR